MNKILKLISSVLIAFLATISISKAEVKVVASIKPIHSLVSYVMDGVGKPNVIVDGYNSPHGFSLKPSHAKMIENADLIIWVCLLYTSPSPRDERLSRMPSSA